MMNLQLISTFDAYNLRWKAFLTEDNRTLLRNGVLQLLGEPTISLPFSYVVRNLQILIDKEYPLAYPARFYSEHLEPVFDIIPDMQVLNKAYRTLTNGYIFSDFTLDTWDNSYTRKIWIEDSETTRAAGKLLGSFTKYVVVDFLSYVHDGTREDDVIVYIKGDIYKQLPNPWTVQDLIDVCKDDVLRHKRDELWYEIAECRATNKPVKILTQYNNRVYTEKSDAYGISHPVIVNILRGDDERVRYKD